METFSALLALCAGNSLVTCKFPSQRPITQSFNVLLDLLPRTMVEQTIETPVIWDAITLIMTSLQCVWYIVCLRCILIMSLEWMWFIRGHSEKACIIKVKICADHGVLIKQLFYISQLQNTNILLICRPALQRIFILALGLLLAHLKLSTRHIWPTWWRHQMETFSALLVLCGWNSPAALMFSSIYAWTHSWANNRATSYWEAIALIMTSS